YASPEQVSAADLDPRSDIYSLGIILFELLALRVPFSGPNPFAVMSKQLSEPVPSIRNIRPDLSPSIEFVVKKALAKNPKDRYQNAIEMADDLSAAITPALAVAAGMRLPGDANHDDLTVSDRSWQAPVAKASMPPQLLIFILLNTAAKPGAAPPAILGVLLGTCINLLALAAIGFVAVTRSRTIRKNFYRCLIVAIIAPLIGGFFISFGAVGRNHELYLPIVTYFILLLSNIYTIRQLSRVDVAHEQFERAPVLWRSDFG